jgi:hypothetical protein
MTATENLRLNKHDAIRGKTFEEAYPKYDNYDAIEVSYTDAIPEDYDGVMGVPISFLDKFCPEQFEILGMTCRNYSPEFVTKIYTKEDYSNANDMNGSAQILLNGDPKQVYSRILIRKK